MPKQLTVRRWYVGLLLIAAFGLSACESAQRINQADKFAEAGVVFTEKLPSFYDEYYRLAIKADSVTLAQTREESGLSRAQLGARLNEANEDLKRTSAILGGLKEHAALLKQYFTAIKELTDENVGEGTGEATAALAGRLEATRVEFGKGKPFGVPVPEIAGAAGNFVVVSLKNRALKRELDERGATIDAELAVQEAILKKLGRNMIADHEAWVIATLENPTFADYQNTKKALPKRWYRKRLRYLTGEEAIVSATEAGEAMKEMRKAWRELAGGGPEGSTVDRLIGHVNKTIALIEALKA